MSSLPFQSSGGPSRPTRSRSFLRRPGVCAVLSAALLLSAALAPGASAETHAIPPRTADQARLEALSRSVEGLVVEGLAAEMPAAAGLALSTAVPLTAAAGRDTVATPGDAWLAAGVETVTVAEEPVPGQPLYEPATRQRLAVYEIRFEITGEEGATKSVVRPVDTPRILAPLLRSPQPLLRDGGLAGLAWLEGDDVRSLALRFAPRNADTGAWGEVETVAGPGPGSQLAPAAAHLDDGSTLLAWSRFDGQDDDIYWSLRRDGAWSEPRSLAADDATPDVTPVLLAVPGGALAAWAGYAGDGYRVFLARWNGESWSEPIALPGPGSFPSFEAVAGDGPAGAAPLLYRSGDSWRVVDVDAAGHPVRQARLRSAGQARPRVTAVDGGGPTLDWTDRPGIAPGNALSQALLRWEALPDAGSDAGEGSP